MHITKKNLILTQLIFIISFILQSCLYNHGSFENTGKYRLKNKINKLISDYGFKTSIGIDIRSLNKKKSIYNYRGNTALTPASNLKLYTSATTLIKLSNNFRFSTKIYKNKNNIFIKGSGDPEFSFKNLDSLAKLISKNIDNIDTLIADITILDSNKYGPGWMWDEGQGWHAAQISPLNLNSNCIDFFINPRELGKPVKINFHPKTNYIKIINNSMILSDSVNLKKFTINRDWKNRNNIFTIKGNKIKSSKIDSIQRNIYNPELFTLTVFTEILNKYNVKVHHVSLGEVPDRAILIFENLSEPLIKINKKMMYESDNLSAEIFTKTLATKDTIPGNWDTGLKIIKSILADSANLDTSKLNLADGSGLSRYNLSSAKNFTQFLEYVYFSKYKDSFISSLPYGGSKSTLKERLINFDYNIRAKTGSLSGVSCISGYIFSKKYGPLCFSILINGYTGSSYPHKKLQDDIITLLIND